MQTVASSCGLNVHAAEFNPNEEHINLRGTSGIPSGYTASLSDGPRQLAKGSDVEGSDAKAIQDVDSSGVADLTVTPSSGVALSGVKDGVAKTDEREIAGDHDVDHHESDEPGLEQSELKRSEQSEAEASHRPIRPCNFEEDGDEPDMHDDYNEVHRINEEEIAWQLHLDKMVEDQIMNDVANRAIEEAKARAITNEVEVPDFIKAEKKGNFLID